MVNARRGEIEAVLDGRRYTLCLTLGALAELESAFGDADMVALAERFSSGRPKAGDIVRLIGAGLRAGGNDIGDAAVARMMADGGVAGLVAVAVRLLEATYGNGAGANPVAGPVAAEEGTPARTAPFPGPT